MRRKLLRGAAAATLSLGLSMLVIPVAFAHAAYESSEPANGASLSSPPTRITAEFTEPVTKDSRLEVYDPCGERVDNGDSLIAADRITISMSADKQGAYRIHFVVISSVDGHPTSGDFGFSSSGGSPCPGTEPAEEGSEGSGGSGGDSETGNKEKTEGGSARGSASAQADRAARESDAGRPQAQKRADNEPGRSVRREDAATRSRSDRMDMEVSTGATTISTSPVVSIWDGIPLMQFLVALLVAAVIGSAGGFVYAGIMGPKT